MFFLVVVELTVQSKSEAVGFVNNNLANNFEAVLRGEAQGANVKPLGRRSYNNREMARRRSLGQPSVKDAGEFFGYLKAARVAGVGAIHGS